MNLTGNGTFQEGNEIAKAKTGKKHNSTIIKELLSENLSSIDNRLYEITFELLNCNNLKVKAFAWKELLKYRSILENIKTDEPKKIFITMFKRKSYEDGELLNPNGEIRNKSESE